MRKLKEGKSYTGDEIAEILGVAIHEERLYAFGNDKKIIVAEDEGNDNWKVLIIIKRR